MRSRYHMLPILIIAFLVISDLYAVRSLPQHPAQGDILDSQHQVMRMLLQTNGSQAVEAEMAAMTPVDNTQAEMYTLPNFWYREPCSSTIPFCETCSNDATTCYSCQGGYMLRENSCGCLDPLCASCPDSPDICESCSDIKSVVSKKEPGTCECMDGFKMSDLGGCKPIPREPEASSPKPDLTKQCIDMRCLRCSSSPDLCEECAEDFMLSKNMSCIPVSRETSPSPSPKDPPCEDSNCLLCPKSPNLCEKCKDDNAKVNEKSGMCECLDGFLPSIRGCLRNPFSNIPTGKVPAPSDDTMSSPTVEKETNNTTSGLTKDPGNQTINGPKDPQLAAKPVTASQPVAMQQNQRKKNATHPGFEYVNIRLETSTPVNSLADNADTASQLLRPQTQGVSGAATDTPVQQREAGWLGKKRWKSMSFEYDPEDGEQSSEDDSSTIGLDSKVTGGYDTDLLRKKQLLLQMLKETDARIEELEANGQE